MRVEHWRIRGDDVETIERTSAEATATSDHGGHGERFSIQAQVDGTANRFIEVYFTEQEAKEFAEFVSQRVK